MANVDETLEEYGYNNNPSKAGYILLTLLLFAFVAIIYLAKRWSDEHTRYLQINQSYIDLTGKYSATETRNVELANELADLQTEIELQKEKWTSKVADLESLHKQELQRTYDHINEIVYDSKNTLTYINKIEGQLRKGQKMSRMEASKLEGVVRGLAFLHDQYQKPMNEFKELDNYFKRQLESISYSSAASSGAIQAAPTTVAVGADPADTTKLLGKILQNKKYKADRDAYLEEKGRAKGVAQGVVQGRASGIKEGKREALTQARKEVQEAYWSAQWQMKQLAVDKDKYLKQLGQVVEWNNISVAEVEDFFKNSKQILKIHDEIMSVDPGSVKKVRP